jgi:D-alanyl-D-alanine carboxypeptidase
MALLTRAYLRAFPEMLHYHATRAIQHNGVVGVNKNPFVGSAGGVDGLKSGWISASGYSLITTAQRNGHRLILVVMGSVTPELRAQDTIYLLEAGFASIEATNTVRFQLAQLKPGQYTISLWRARQEALQGLFRPAKVHGSIGSPKPAPITPAAAAAPVATVTAPIPRQTKSSTQASPAKLVVGSIGSPAPAPVRTSGNRDSPLIMATR